IQHDRYVPRKESERCWRQDGRYGRSDSTTIQGKSHQPPGFLRQDLSSGDNDTQVSPHVRWGCTFQVAILRPPMLASERAVAPCRSCSSSPGASGKQDCYFSFIEYRTCLCK